MQSKAQDGVPDAVVRTIADQLVTLAAKKRQV
jgi:hypothetical protein